MNFDLVAVLKWLQEALSTGVGQLAIFLAALAVLVRTLFKSSAASRKRAEDEADQAQKQLEVVREQARLSEQAHATQQRTDLLTRIGALEKAYTQSKAEREADRRQCDKDREAARRANQALSNQIALMRGELVSSGKLPPASFGPEMLDGFTEKQQVLK